MSRLLVAAALAVVLAAGIGSKAHAQANCDWYVLTSLKQQQQNERRKCNFKGPEWSSDRAAHLKWCTSVAPDVWKAAAQKRDQMLTNCK